MRVPFRLPKLKSRDVNVKIQKKRLYVALKNQEPVIDAEFPFEIKVTRCGIFSLQFEENSSKRTVSGL